MLILMDRSVSMAGEWMVLSSAVETLVSQNPQVNWGLALYGGDNYCQTAIDPVVAVGGGNALAITGALAGTSLGGEAPAAAAITSAASLLQGLGDSHQKYILLVTGGHPGCAQDADTATTSAATSIGGALTQAGIPTFVLGDAPTSDTAAVLALNQMAVSGGEPLQGTDHAYYAPADITLALQPTDLGVSCVLALSPLPATLSGLAVVLTLNDGHRIQVPQAFMNGWTYTDASMTAIALSGNFCTELNDGTATEISVTYVCGGVPGDIIRQGP
jgi:hypothetical protein